MAPKFLLFLLTLALVAACNGEHAAAAAAADDGDADLLQRQENMAEVIRLSRDPASNDPETMHRASAFMRRELGPFGVVLNAIAKLPESVAAEVRVKADAQAAAEELLIRLHRQLLRHDKAKSACRQAGRCASSE